MGCAFGCDAGGIAGLLTAPRELWEAVEADLLGMGFTVADVPGRLSWRALCNWLRWAPRESAVFRQQNPDGRWTAAEHRAADVADLLQGLIYVTRAAHFKGKPQLPEPLPRPGGHKQQAPPRGLPLDVLQARLDEIDRRDRAGVSRMRQAEAVRGGERN